MRLPQPPRPPHLKAYIPKRTPLHISRLMENFEDVRSWSQKYPYLGIPVASFNKLYKSYAKLKPKVESMNESARLYNQRLPKTSSRPTSSPNTKRCVSVKTASRNSGPTPWADGGGTLGWLEELSKDSETSSELSGSPFLDQRSFEHSIKEYFDYTVHPIEVQERAGSPKKDKLTTNIAYSPKIGIACGSEKGSIPSLAPTKSAEPVKCNSEWLKWSIPGYNVFHGRGLISTMFSNLVTMPSQKSREASTCGKMQRLELVHCGLKDSGLAEEPVLEPLDLAVMQDLSREELSNAAEAIVKESLLPTCHTVLLFEVPTLESEDAEIIYEFGKSQVPDLESGGPDFAGILIVMQRGPENDNTTGICGLQTLCHPISRWSRHCLAHLLDQEREKSAPGCDKLFRNRSGSCKGIHGS